MYLAINGRHGIVTKDNLRSYMATCPSSLLDNTHFDVSFVVDLDLVVEVKHSCRARLLLVYRSLG